MNDFLNKAKLADYVVNAIDANLKGEAKRMYIDSHQVTKDLVVDFVQRVEEALAKRFSN